MKKQSPRPAPRMGRVRQPIRHERPRSPLFSDAYQHSNRKERRSRYLSFTQSTRLQQSMERLRLYSRKESRRILYVVAPIAILAILFVAVAASPVVVGLIFGGLLFSFWVFPRVERGLRRRFERGRSYRNKKNYTSETGRKEAASANER